jgi:hypothetical protein
MSSNTNSGTGDDIRAQVESIPAGNWTATMGLSRGFPLTHFVQGGLIMRESGTSKLIFGPKWDHTNGIGVDKWTNLTTASATYVDEAATPLDMFARIIYDGTNYTWQYSIDGEVWIQLLKKAKADFFTTAADQIGYAVNLNANAGTFASWPLQLGVWHWFIG